MLSRGVDVKERRLKTIYDALDAANNKKAIQEAEKVLRKDPSCQTAKALKGLAMFRGHRNIEASILLNELSNEEPSDEACLQAMTYYYREAGYHEKISEIYENAHKKKPSNEDIMTTLFMAHVRLMNFQRQHQIARDLHKLIPSKMPYFFWSVMSLFMQAKSAENGLGVKMFLPLAEKMVKKVIDDGKLKAEAEYELYLMILEEQGKYDESLKFLTSSPLTEKVLKDRCAITRYEMNYLRELKRDFSLFVKTRESLKKNPDDWALLKEYLERGIGIVENNQSVENGTCNSDSDEASLAEMTYESLCSFLDTLREENSYMRGPHLARLLFIQLTKRLEASTKVPDVGDPVALMVEYFKRFGCKPVCPYDLLLFFDDIIQPSRREEFIEKLESSQEKNDESPKTVKDLDSMYQRLCIEMMIRKCGHHAKYNKEEREAKIKDLMEIYNQSLTFGSQLERTELQPADGFILLVVLMIFDEWLEASKSQDADSKPQSILWRAVLTIESALAASQSNHHLKICLLKIYCFLGAYQPALSTFQSLEIKHIQYDSLGYLISKPGLHLASFSSALGVWNNIVKFFAVNRKDMMEYVVSAYRSGSFRKIPEFIDFHKRLSNSFEYYSSNIELRLQTVFSNSSKFEEILQTFSDLAYDIEKEDIEYGSLVDGRDFSVTVRFEPQGSSGTFTDEDQKESFKDEIRWMQLRSLTIQFIAVACKLIMEGSKHVSSSNDTSSDKSVADSEIVKKAVSLLQQLETLGNEIEVSPYQVSKCTLLSPYASTNSLYNHGCYADALKDGLNLLLYLNNLAQNPEVYDSTYESSLKETLTEKIVKFKDSIVQSAGRSFSETLTKLVCLCESLSIMTIFLMGVESLFKPLRKPASKRKKKALPMIESSSLSRSIAPIDTAMTAVYEVVDDVRQVVEGFDESWKSVKDLDVCLETSPSILKEEIVDSVRSQASRSYSASVNELSRMLEYISARRTSHN